jgi:Cdc6-like AAA superfamily ATPase
LQKTDAGHIIDKKSFIGRKKELAALVKQVSECFSLGQSTAVLFTGMPAQGKTALSCEFYRRNSHLNAHYLLCHPQAPDLYELKQFLASVFAQGSSPDKAAFEQAYSSYAKPIQKVSQKICPWLDAGTLLAGIILGESGCKRARRASGRSLPGSVSLLAQSGKLY